MKSAHFSDLMDIAHIGWMLMHSVWQASAIAAVLWIVLFLLRRKSARLRYGLACGAMGLALVSPVIAVWWTMPALDRGVSGMEVIPDAEAAPPQTVLVDASGVELDESPLSLRQHIDRYLPSVAKFWLVCVVILSVRLGIGFGRTRAWKGASYLIVDPRWTIPLKHCITTMNFSRPVMLLQSMHISVPMTLGWLSPVILIPASLASGLTPLQIKGILAHELAHIRRHDYLVNLIQTMIETLMFYHPAVRWMGDVIRQERENCCDDIASEIVGDSRGYAQTLVRVEELCHMKNELSLALTGGVLLPRIQRLLGTPVRRRLLSGQAAPALAILIGLLVIGCVASREQSSAGSPAPTAPTTEEVLAPGSRIDLTLTGEVRQVQSDIHVGTDGVIEVEEVGRVLVNGQTSAQAQSAIESLFKSHGKQVEAQITRHTTNDVKVANPSPPLAPAAPYAKLPTAPTPPSAPQAVEIPRTTAGPRNVLEEKSLDEQAAHDAKVAAERASTIASPPARTNMPVERRAATGEYFVSGSVTRAGVYSLGERKVTVLQAIIAAGVDPTSMPGGEVLIIRRESGNKEKAITFSIRDLLDNRELASFIEPSDTILVKAPEYQEPAPATQQESNRIETLRKAAESLRFDLKAMSQLLGANHPNYVRTENQLRYYEQQIRKLQASAEGAPSTKPSN